MLPPVLCIARGSHKRVSARIADGSDEARSSSVRSYYHNLLTAYRDEQALTQLFVSHRHLGAQPGAKSARM